MIGLLSLYLGGLASVYATTRLLQRPVTGMISVSSNFRASISFSALLSGVALFMPAYAQSRLPACPDSEDVRWHICQGTFIWPDGEKYVGEFRDDKRSGQGIFTWSNGEKYVGEFRDNKRNGKGTRYSASGSVLEQGLWKDGELVREGEVTPPAPPAPRVASASTTAAAPVPPTPSPAPTPAAPAIAPAPKGIQQSDPERSCNEQAEAARTEQLKRISSFSSKALGNYDPKSGSCYALLTIMPKGQPAAMFIEVLVDASSNTSLAKIEHRGSGGSIGIISDKSYKGSGMPPLGEVQAYIDQKMGGKR